MTAAKAFGKLLAGLACCWLMAPLFAADPLELARGLRAIGQPDLALDYLDELERGDAPAAIRLLIPLERAHALLARSEFEGDEVQRRAGLRQARGEFEGFLRHNPRHVRAPEAQLGLAQLTSAEAVMQLSRARRSPGGDAERAAKRQAEALEAARRQFEEAGKSFQAASASIKKLLASDSLDEAFRQNLERSGLRAELEMGINQFRLAETYNPAAGPAREQAFKAAKAIFDAVAAREPLDPAVWKARAWAAMCLYELGGQPEAEKLFRQIKTEAARHALGADGVRLVDFFETQIRYLDAVAKRTRPTITLARSQVLAWLEKDRYKPRMTAERLSMTFYYALLTQLLGNLEVVLDKPPPGGEQAGDQPRIRSISQQGKELLREAARSYARLLDFDNEYSERAAENRSQCIRLIVGEEPRAPAAYEDFEECQMAALMQARKFGEARLAALQQADDPEAAAKAQAAFDQALALMERAQALIRPDTPAREVAESRLNLAVLHWEAGNYQRAAEIASALVRSQRGKIAARAGLLAVDALIKQRERRSPENDAQRGQDREQAFAILADLETNFPSDPSTDSARRLLAMLLANEREHRKAFELLDRVSPNADDLAVVRTAQLRLAFLLQSDSNQTLTPAEQQAIYDRAVAAANAVPRPGQPGVADFQLRNMLATLHLTKPPEGFALAERIASETIQGIQASTLPDDEKSLVFLAAEEARLRGKLGQALALFQQGQYEAMVNFMAPALAEIQQRGRAAQPQLEGEAKVLAASLDGVRREFVLLGMNGQIRLGQFDRAAKGFELLDKLGGTPEATSGTLTRLVNLVRPRIEQLRKDNQPQEAEALAESVARMLRKQADKPGLSPMVVASLGRSLRELSQWEEALRLLEKVPRPADALLAVKTTELAEDDRNAVIAFQIAQIERVRALRALNRFDEAAAILDDALGTETAPGWARSLEFRREAVLLLEDRAAALETAEVSERRKAWAEAKTGWERLANQYAGLLRNPKLEPNDREKLAPIYLELLCDLRRCIARGNAQLLAEMPERLAESHKRIAAQVLEVETANPKVLTTEVRKKYRDFLNDYPPIREAYIALGGKAFLDG